MMSIFDDAEVISRYPLAQAIKDGILVEVFKNRWGELSNGKPIVATAHLFHEISLAGLMEIWNEFVQSQNRLCQRCLRKTAYFIPPRTGKKSGSL
jgi:hypothetical protein